MAETTEQEQDAISAFCQAEREIQACLKQCQDSKRPLTEQKRGHLDALGLELEAARRQSLCVEIDGTRWQVGRKNSKYLKRITESLVRQGIGTLEIDDELEQVATFDELAQHVLQLIQTERTVRRTYVAVQKAPPTRQCTPIANREAVVHEIRNHRACNETLRDLSTRSKARVDGLRQTNESAEVLGFLERTQQDFQSITMPGEAGGSDVRYNIRRQVVSKVVNLGKDALLQLVQRAVGSVLDIDEDEENLPDLTPAVLARLVAQREPLAQRIMELVRAEPRREKVLVSLRRTRGANRGPAEGAPEAPEEEESEEAD